MKAVHLLTALLLLLSVHLVFAGTTGKIAGTITDGRTGEPLPSANVILDGTTLGAVTNVDGYYVILNVPPGQYRLKASFVGYRPSTVLGVRVEIDQTTTQNLKLSEEAVTGEEVVITATRPVVERDVAASRANIDIKDVQKLPVTTVASAIGLQAGVQGLSVRGGFNSELAFMVNGALMRDERTNAPYTSVSLLSVQEIQLTTGGFSAEYGNVRSGIVNIVTKEGSKSNYNVSMQGRYGAVAPKHFGPSIYDANSYWIRPYLDPAVAWTGTQNGAWDRWTLKQYPSFQGWNAISQRYAANSDPTDDLTPEALQRLFLWQRRKVAEVTKPDYDVDFTLGGPIPFLSDYAGNLRFFAAYHRSQNMYLIPLSEDAYRDYSGSFKLTSDISSVMKLTAEIISGKTWGTNSNNAGTPGLFQTPEDIANVMDRVSYIDTRIFATDYWAPSSTNYRSFSTKFSHTPSATTFYDVSFNVFRSEYHTNPGRFRDTSKVYLFGNSYYVDESPFGFAFLPNPASGLEGIRFGVGFSNSRDTSITTTYDFRFDGTAQLDKYNQVKAGVELVYTNLDIHYGLFDAFLKDQTYSNSYNRFPIKGALYAKDKLEFQGMVADIGVRLDYLNPQGTWYVYDNYSQAFSSKYAPGLDTLLQQQKTKKQVVISPRLGFSFPITDESKLFFNYGHFRQQPASDNLFLLRRSGFDNSIARVADPNALLPRTVAYELGYEQGLFDEYLMRITAYYKDISDEPYLVNYTNRNSSVEYIAYTSNAYRDIRGLEFTASKNRGNWFQGFINYTYQVSTSGYFGSAQYYQNLVDQTVYNRKNVYQEKPIPRPFARLNLDLFTPPDFGPKIAGMNLLGDWRVNLLGNWMDGYYFTWTGGADIPGVLYNVQWTDYWDFDMRISKTFQFGPLNVQLFADISNLLNYKYMNFDGVNGVPRAGFATATDYTDYMMSLHLPKFSSDVDQKIGYVNISGDDRPGDYRKEGAAFQPIVAYRQLSQIQQLASPETRPFYYAADVNQYFQWANGTWQQVDPGKLQQVLDDKAYIDMPNQETFWFLNPRRIFWGIRLSWDI